MDRLKNIPESVSCISKYYIAFGHLLGWSPNGQKMGWLMWNSCVSLFHLVFIFSDFIFYDNNNYCGFLLLVWNNKFMTCVPDASWMPLTRLLKEFILLHTGKANHLHCFISACLSLMSFTASPVTLPVFFIKMFFVFFWRGRIRPVVLRIPNSHYRLHEIRNFDNQVDCT